MKKMFRLKNRETLRRTGAFFVLSAVIVGAAALFTAPASGGRSITRLKQGVFLLASPELHDPNFSKTAVLLVHHDSGGATGLIINRPTDIPAEKALPNSKGMKGLRESLFLGGPVQRDFLLALIWTDRPPERAKKVIDRVYFTADKESLLGALQDGNPDKKIRLYAGYAGWGPRQLEREIIRGDWTILDADPGTIFSKEPSNVWQELSKAGEKVLIRGPDPDRLLGAVSPSLL